MAPNDPTPQELSEELNAVKALVAFDARVPEQFGSVELPQIEAVRKSLTDAGVTAGRNVQPNEVRPDTMRVPQGRNTQIE